VSGAVHGATRHWRNQRLTSIALVPLGLWFVISLLRQPALDYAVVSGWFAKPLQAFLAALLGAALLWHSMQGWQVVLGDYVSGRLHAFSVGFARVAHTAAALVLGYALFRLVAGA
jgi:succinate dehydrogenase membrane anchor subunit